MRQKLKRVFYVTPVNFVELLKGFEKILSQKRKELNIQITKLQNGLTRLEDAKKEVQQMTVDSEARRVEVTKTSSQVQ